MHVPYHDTVKNALIKENWTITSDQLFIHFGGFDMDSDLGMCMKLLGQP